MSGPTIRLFLIQATVWGLSAGSLLLAQDAPTQQQQAAPNVTVGRNYWFEILLVVLLFGAALWAICKPSRRN